MFCMNCGTKLPDGAKFCLNCGTPLISPEESKPSSIQSEKLELDFQEEKAVCAVNKSISNSFDDDYEENDEDTEEDGEDTEEVEDDIDNDDEDDDYGGDDHNETQESDTNGIKSFVLPKREKNDGALEKTEKNPFKKLKGLSIQSDKVPETTADSKRTNRNEPLTPANDPYWDDVLPEINDELYQIPKDTIVKTLGIVVAVAASIAWLIFMLPNF